MTVNILTRRAPAASRTWDPETQSFEAMLSAGSPVQRADQRGAFDEVLDLSTVTLPDRVPFLDALNRDSWTASSALSPT